MEEIESDTDSNLSVMFLDSDNSSVEAGQAVLHAPVQVGERGASRLATRDANTIIHQLKL